MPEFQLPAMTWREMSELFAMAFTIILGWRVWDESRSKVMKVGDQVMVKRRIGGEDDDTFEWSVGMLREINGHDFAVETDSGTHWYSEDCVKPLESLPESA